jgi:nifR3 family TIM-barrel protein
MDNRVYRRLTGDKMNRSFWQTLPRPIIGLAPMDGVTDAAFRFISAKYGKPAIHFSEFTHVEGICRGIPNVLRNLEYNEIERPVVAQVFGNEPSAFYKVAHIIGTLGFDGIDINMGCPDRAVAARGCGAGLIQTPKLAQAIIRATHEGARDFADGKLLEKIGLSETTCATVRKMASKNFSPRRLLPVSVKTRLGYDRVVIESWIGALLEMEPSAITLHGRTLKQGYRGDADWEAIGRAVEIARTTKTLVLGNGDILTQKDARERISQYGVEGVLVGRGAMGNPWFFQDNDSCLRSARERWAVALEHATVFDRMRGTIPFTIMRKHLGWYARGKEGGLRSAMVRVESLSAVEQLLVPVLSSHPEDLCAPETAIRGFFAGNK